MIITMIVALVILLGIAAYIGYREAPIWINRVIGVDLAAEELDKTVVVAATHNLSVSIIQAGLSAASLEKTFKRYADAIEKAYIVPRRYFDD